MTTEQARELDAASCLKGTVTPTCAWCSLVRLPPVERGMFTDEVFRPVSRRLVGKSWRLVVRWRAPMPGHSGKTTLGCLRTRYGESRTSADFAVQQLADPNVRVGEKHRDTQGDGSWSGALKELRKAMFAALRD
mmetsp:Transcript_43469/g.114644  ORF Transcript_43469/g.114644 Transcript_43469/m.114644 type:complete len:134 (+) Transcript_43469:563-964(+)